MHWAADSIYGKSILSPKMVYTGKAIDGAFMQHKKNGKVPIGAVQKSYVLYCVERRGVLNLLQYI